MGKKKQKQATSDAAQAKKPSKDPKTPKSYSFAGVESTRTSTAPVVQETIAKVQIPTDQESVILDLINDHRIQRGKTGSVSLRMTNKKLKDVYESLSSAGFKSRQVEQAMENTIFYGGDLMDALDWLCLNTPNDQLPEGFSQTFTSEEQKKRPGFVEPESKAATVSSPEAPSSENLNSAPKASENSSKPHENSPKASVKDWILQYAEQSSEEEAEDKTEEEADPNEKYLELTAKLLDAKSEAVEAKQSGDKPRQRKIGGMIRQICIEMERLENHPGFNPAIKIEDISESKALKVSKPAAADEPAAAAAAEPVDVLDAGGFSMFEEQEAPKKRDPPKKKSAPKFEKMSFEYTRQQWTGKSPKQFLIDWMRKHLPKSPPPSYQKVPSGGGLWRSRVKIVKKDETLELTPEKIATENLKEAEHLASAWALYHLCKGQRVYQLLPPPYRDVWLSWQAEEDEATEKSKEAQNKPRDQFLARLMKKLKVDPGKSNASPSEDKNEDVEESWEDLDSGSDEDDQASRVPAAKRHTRGPSSHALKSLMLRNKESAMFKKLLPCRQELPVFQHQQEILELIHQQNVVVIAGETGSGKSTQIPQFILEDLIHCNLGAESSVVVTEPRRISATSLATRVSQELGGPGPGVRDSLCGYQIHFESKRSQCTRLLYCTTGVLLRKLQMDPMLRDVSHIIVDEVHERSTESDFLLIILKQLLGKRHDLHVILMSATLDSDKFSAYFNHCPVLSIPGRTFPVEVLHLPDILKLTDYSLEEDSKYSLRTNQLIQEEHTQVKVTGQRNEIQNVDVNWSKEDIHQIDYSGLSPEAYSLKVRNIVTRMDPTRINFELLCALLVTISKDEQFQNIEGSILIFLPGLSDIQELYEILMADRHFADKSKFRVIALHSVLSSEDQNQAFDVPPDGVRKIVIATNIAETGITIPDVVFVIDCGKVKETRYAESSQLSCLEEVFVSKASAKQRQGRAGRVRKGFCFRTYTLQKFESFKNYSVPEILRVPLEGLCLHIMKSGLGSPAEFLSLALDPPTSAGIARAMTTLREIGACAEGPSLTPLGHHLAALPVNVRLGKMLVYSAVLGCLEPMAVIAAAMSDKSPFVAPLDKKQQADEARHRLALANSDHITVYNAYLGWKKAQTMGHQADIDFCQKNFLRRNTLLDMENTKKDLMALVHSVGFQDISTQDLLKSLKSRTRSKPSAVINISECNPAYNFTSDHLTPAVISILRAVLTAGLYPNLGAVSYVQPVDHAVNETKQVCTAQTPQGAAQVHPMSINRYLAANGWLVYLEKVKSSRVYLRDATLITPYPILLFGGSISVQHQEQIIAVDDWIKFKAFAKTAVIFKELRILLDDLLSRKLKNPSLDLAGETVIKVIVDLIARETVR